MTCDVTINGEAYTLETDDQPCVTWKDEDEVGGESVGPCTYLPNGRTVRVRDSDGTVLIGLPYRGDKDDADEALAGEVDHGWQTRRKAQALARKHGVPFVEV